MTNPDDTAHRALCGLPDDVRPESPMPAPQRPAVLPRLDDTRNLHPTGDLTFWRMAQEALDAANEAARQSALAAVEADYSAQMAWQKVERLRAAIREASDPDFLWGAMDNVHDMDSTLDDYAAAASRAIRAALEPKP